MADNKIIQIEVYKDEKDQKICYGMSTSREATDPNVHKNSGLKKIHQCAVWI